MAKSADKQVKTKLPFLQVREMWRHISCNVRFHLASLAVEECARRHKKDLVKIASKVICILMSLLLLFKLKF